MKILRCTGCEWEISADHEEQYKPCMEEVPAEARLAIQKAIWRELPDNEWTTWTDSCILAEIAARKWAILRLTHGPHTTTPYLLL